MKMMMLVGAVVLAAGLNGCAGNGDGGQRTSGERVGAPARGGLSGDQAAKVERAARVANAINARPEDADRVLRENGMTERQFEDLMYEIASDAAMAAEYDARVR